MDFLHDQNAIDGSQAFICEGILNAFSTLHLQASQVVKAFVAQRSSNNLASLK